MPRPTILTQAALARVASLVEQGRTAAEIATEIGCTLGTLRVRCSQHGISLRRRATRSREETITAAETNIAAHRGSSPEACIELKVLLPQITTEQLQQRGALRGISGSTLASELLAAIARDGLYDAVLDGC
jgi:transposase-like protein